MVALSVCHRCEFRQRECAGPCACTVSGIDIMYASGSPCPKGFHAGSESGPRARSLPQITQNLSACNACDEFNLQVDTDLVSCDKGCQTCSGIRPGNISLAYGTCNLGRWS